MPFFCFATAISPGARRRGAELQEQIDGLIANKHQTQQKLAEVAAESESRFARLQESGVELAEALAKLSSRDTQLKDVSITHVCLFFCLVLLLSLIHI